MKEIELQLAIAVIADMGCWRDSDIEVEQELSDGGMAYADGHIHVDGYIEDGTGAFVPTYADVDVEAKAYDKDENAIKLDSKSIRNFVKEEIMRL